ncbi:MAG: hypothetical protein K5856_04475 [Bacteroidaceae bacterium]|nr:hypothetical protein [Bacteroidaceae bacterium]
MFLDKAARARVASPLSRNPLLTIAHPLSLEREGDGYIRKGWSDATGCARKPLLNEFNYECPWKTMENTECLWMSMENHSKVIPLL